MQPVFFLGASNATAVQPIVHIERTVLYREKAAGMYSPLSYAIGQVMILPSSFFYFFKRIEVNY
jgi:ABC-2 type transporter